MQEDMDCYYLYLVVITIPHSGLASHFSQQLAASHEHYLADKNVHFWVLGRSHCLQQYCQFLL